MNNTVLHSIMIFLCLIITDSLQKEVGVFISTINLTRTQRQANYGFICTLPHHPENGRWSVYNGKGVEQPGEAISENTIVRYECNEGYVLTGNTFLICDKEWKSSSMPECEKLCPPLRSTATTFLTCKDKNVQDISCDGATEGSYLTAECAPYYEIPSGNKKNLVCLAEGIWNYPKPVCQPVCGKKIGDEAKTLIYGGQVTKVLEYPWVATLFRENESGYENICGGSIISQRAVLTAAHCFYDGRGERIPLEFFKIAAGKLYNKYEDPNDTNAQYLDIFRIIIHSDFRHKLRNYLADIAIIVTRKPFVLSNVIQPICLNNVNTIHLHANNSGVVCGFGLDESGTPSERLRFLKIAYKHSKTCAEELPNDFIDKYYLPDKICAGFINQSKSVCEGDSGNGLAFWSSDHQRYYIHGIVSLAPFVNEKCDIEHRVNESCCNIQQNTLYTSVVHYYTFIDKAISKYTVDDCLLPDFPKNGKWVVPNQDSMPGDSVQSNTILKISCNRGFKSSSEIKEVSCDSAAEMPQCLPSCPALTSTEESTITCQDQKGTTMSCSDAPESTILKHKCPDGTETTRHCKRGSWGTPLPQCQQVTEVPRNEGSTTKVICSYKSFQKPKVVSLEDLDVSLCHYFIYQAASLDAGTSDRGLYDSITQMKQKNSNLKIILSIGEIGTAFSSIAASPKTRSEFVKEAKEVLQMNNFDGLEINWHIQEVKEKDNYVDLLRDIKRAFQPHGLLLTASVPSDPDGGYDGRQMSQILDWVIVQTYDMYGYRSNYTGQNSPLYASFLENDWEKEHLNMDASGKNWIAAGVDRKKLALSIAFFGRSFTLSNNQEHGIHVPINGAGLGEGGGFLRYSDICENYGSWSRVWDNEQKNPYKYSGNQWFGYDDSDSVFIKAEYIKNNGFFGVNVSPIDGDDVYGKCGEKQILLKRVRGGLGHLTN